MSSRRRMIAAVACLSWLYFSIIELIAFSYAISGCFFSTSLIQSDTNPRHRLAKRPKNPTFAMSRSVVETGVAWNKIKSLFIVQENEPSGAPAASADDHAVIEAELQKFQVPASEPPAQLPPDTNPAALSGTIDFQAMYDTAGVPNTDEVEALEKFLVELEADLPQA